MNAPRSPAPFVPSRPPTLALRNGDAGDGLAVSILNREKVLPMISDLGGNASPEDFLAYGVAA